MSDNPNEYAFDASSSYSLHIGSDVTGGSMGSPFTRYIKSIVFTKNKQFLFNLPQKLYVPKTYCAADLSHLDGFENYEIYAVTDDVEAGTAPVDMTNLQILSMNPASAGYKISLANGAYVISTLVAGDIVSNHYISPAEYYAKSAAEREHYREVPINLPSGVDWDYLYSADSSSSSVNVGLVDGKYRLIESLESHDFTFNYTGGGRIVRYLNEASPGSGVVATKLADIRRQNGSSYIYGTLYYLPDSGTDYRTTFGGVNGVEVNTETGTVSLSLRIAKSGRGYLSSELPSSDSSSYNDYFDTYLFDCPSTIFGSATSSDFTEETLLSPGTGQPVGNGMFHYSGEIVYFDYNAPTPVDPTPVEPTETTYIIPKTTTTTDTETQTQLHISNYVVKVDGVPVPDGRSVSFVENSNTEHVIALFAFYGTSEVQVTSGVSWVVEDLTNLSSTPSTEHSATLTYSAVCEYRITPRVNNESNDVAVRDSFDFAIEEALVSPSTLGLHIAMYPSTGGTPQYIELTEDQEGPGEYGTAYNVTVPYRPEGYSFVLLDSYNNNTPIAGSGDGLTLQWFVEFPDGRTGFAFNRATLRDPSLLGGAGDYAIYAFVSGQHNNQNIGSYSVPVAKINLTIQTVINVSWVAVSYEN